MLLLVQTRSWLYSQYIKYAGRNLAHNGKCENPAAPRVGRKLNNGSKCHPEKGGGQKKREQKSTNYVAESVVAKIKANCCHNKAGLHERILGHANRAAVTGRCQTENSKRNGIAVHLCRDQARNNSHKGAIAKRCQLSRFCYVSFKFRYCSIALLHFLDD